jgi:ribosome-associated protein
MTEAAEKKDVQKLQRVIVDALEDVKASNVAVFNTEHISSLFERVIIASGTSNRQTKALAASVRDQVRQHGFAKPRIEGEENGEWIIVDCGAAVAHIMQPTIREYYNLEEIWGEKPVRLKFGAPKPAVAEPKAVEKRTKGGKATAKTSGAKSSASKDRAPAKKSAASANAKGKALAKTSRKAPAKTSSKAPATTPSKAPAKKTAAKTVSAKSSSAKSASKPRAASAGAKTSTTARKRSTPKA